MVRAFLLRGYTVLPFTVYYLKPTLINISFSLFWVTVVPISFQHEFKKIRNSICSKKRALLHDNRPILWSHWQEAYYWDKTLHGMRIHHKLTDDHFDLSTTAKMRNRLANEVLDNNMLVLMKVKFIYFFFVACTSKYLSAK